jgi:hypothetical protein
MIEEQAPPQREVGEVVRGQPRAGCRNSVGFGYPRELVFVGEFQSQQLLKPFPQIHGTTMNPSGRVDESR